MAGLEFALLAPVLLVVFLGIIDISGALLTARRIGSAAAAVAEIASTEAAQVQTLNKVTDSQIWAATTAPFAWFPEWTAAAAKNTFAVTLSYVLLTATPAGCTQACTYTANVAWSMANELGSPQLRACGPLTIVANNNPASYTTLPSGDLGPTSLLVADVSYTFKPVFFGFLIGDIPMMQSAFISPRVNNTIQLVANSSAGVSVTCPP